MKTTLANNFHRTEITLRAKDGWLSKAQVRKARKVLCGYTGCQCGGLAGERGPNPELEPYPDGTVKVVLDND